MPSVGKCVFYFDRFGLNEMQTRKKWTTAILMFVLYAVLSAAITYAVQCLKEEGAGINSGHTEAIRSCVVRPGSETLDDIGGLVKVKQSLRRAVLLPLQRPDLFYKGPQALRPPRGVLLHGPPGTGKTMLARALASECKVNFLSLSSATLESKWWGESAKLVQAAFDLARGELQPCIIFFDEIDGMGKARSDGDQACVYSFKTELLRNMDGIDKEHRECAVQVIACTNCLRTLDPALRRRLPLTIEVPKPDAAARHSILRKLTKEERRGGQEVVGKGSHARKVSTLKLVADLTDGLTGSDLTALYSDASSVRLEESDVYKHVTSATSAEDLLQRAGPLRLKHFQDALQRCHAINDK